MNWFERHLNWTLVLACLVIAAASVVTRLLTPYEVGEWPTVALTYLAPLPPCAWVLKKKSQSLWWLPAVWIPFAWWLYVTLYVMYFFPVFIGWAVPLGLRNRNAAASAREQQAADGSVVSASVEAEKHPLTSAGRKSGSPFHVLTDLASMVPVLLVGVCAMLKSEIACTISGATMLLLVLVLMLLPERIYVATPAVCSVGKFVSVVLGTIGGLDLVCGLLVSTVGESADPGHGGVFIGLCMMAAGAMALGACMVLALRVRSASRGSAMGA